MRRKRKKKVPRYIKMGKVKLSQEEWETRTALTDYFKPGKMEVVLKEAKPKEEEVKLVPAKEEIKLVEARKPMEVKLVEMKSPDEPEREPVKLVEQKPNETGEIKLIEIPKKSNEC